ncbi:MAG: cation:proton antiporter [Chloroflexi bacterium]|nr:cation:proton antiporter [Chloroflexota bacterium]
MLLELPIVAAAQSDVNHTLLLLLAQLSIIIIFSRGLGLLFRRIHQPLVIGEIVAGIMLGPSLFGLLAPTTAAQIFPAETAPLLNILAQVGLLIFMFLIGLELNLDTLKGQSHHAVVISHASIIVPFLLGGLLAFFLFDAFAPAGVSFTAFALFMGASMSITAFPVLARILTESKLHTTPLGALVITCAAVDDVTAWCILAFVVAIVRSGDVSSAVVATLGAALYIGVMVTLVRAGMARVVGWLAQHRQPHTPQLVLALLVVGAFCSAMITEVIGIHTIFGAFLFGAILPRDSALIRELTVKLEDFTTVVLLPIFFAYTGLRTQIGLLNQPWLWLVCGLIILVATAGKFGGAVLAARWVGVAWRPASAIGVLMNTRGLMELIVLNIGLDLGVISPMLFAMMVIMAIVTTFITTPILHILYPQLAHGADQIDLIGEVGAYTAAMSTAPARVPQD